MEHEEQKPITAKTLSEYKKAHDDEMSFSEGAIITNVEGGRMVERRPWSAEAETVSCQLCGGD